MWEKQAINKVQQGDIHGDKLSCKQEGFSRFIFENFDGLAPWKHNNDKIDMAKRFIRRYEADCYSGTECRAQWELLYNKHKLRTLFQTESSIRTVAAHNVHEKMARSQEGGTAMLAFDNLSSVVKETGVDESGLGRWCWMLLQGKNNHHTRIITAYQPCRCNKKANSAVYAQHKRFFKMKGDFRCPRLIFRQHLMEQLDKWQGNGDRIILMIDANENLQHGKLQRALMKRGIRDLVRERTNLPGPATHFRGKSQIDGIFATKDVDCFKACFLPFWTGVGDHRAIVVDIPNQVLYGEQLLKIVRPQMRKLQCHKSKTRDKYNKRLKCLISEHKLQEKARFLYANIRYPLPALLQSLQEQIDQVRKDCMIAAEKKCRKWKMGSVDFSPQVMIWKNRRDTWNMIFQLKKGQHRNLNIIRKKAMACGIHHPLSATLNEAQKGYQICRDEFDRLKPFASKHRREFLSKRLKLKEEEGNMQAVKEIRQIIQHEETRKMWRSISNARCKRNGKSITIVETNINGVRKKVDIQEEVEESIMRNNHKRFLLTYGTPLMNGSELHQDLGFLANTKSAEEILKGTYKYKNQSVDTTTQELLTQISQVFQAHKNHTVNPVITRGDYQKYWRKCKERTSSSFSGLHFGHWKAASHDNNISELHAMLTQISFQSGSPYKRWSTGLSVMLEKVPGVILVDKLRAILLMEADFNFANKLYFGSRMIQRSEKIHLIPPDCFGSRNNHCSIEVSLCRLLFFDIVRQKKFNAALGSYDAQTCYDRIVHSFASLAAQSVGIEKSLIVTMLIAIQQMNFHLRTGYGDSITSYGSEVGTPYQGICQGNGAAPAIWLLISSYIILFLKKKGMTMNIKSAFATVTLSYIALMFVDDGDFPTIATDASESMQSIVSRHQDTVKTWSQGLRVTGGSLKPEKCFWYPIEWHWVNGVAHMESISSKKKRKRSISRLEDTNWVNGVFKKKISAPDPEGNITSVSCLDVSEARNVMGVWQAPTGQMDKQLEVLSSKVQEWIHMLKNNYLPRSVIWRAFWGTLWMSIRYTLPALTITRSQGDGLFIPLYRQLLPKIGVSPTLPLPYRYGAIDHYGLGFPRVHIESLISKIIFFLMHNGTDTLPGQHLQISLEYLELELGMSKQFFSLSYTKYSSLVSNCWLKSLWDEVSQIAGLELNYTVSEKNKPARICDGYLMDSIISLQRYSKDQLVSINRQRLYLHVIYLSDITTGNGTHIRSKFFDQNVLPLDSIFCWPRIKTIRHDFYLWAEALYLISSLSKKWGKTLGGWIRKSHLKYQDYYNPTTHEYYTRSIQDEGSLQKWDQYCPISERNTRNHSNFKFSQSIVNIPSELCIATANKPKSGYLEMEGFTSSPKSTMVPKTLIEVVKRWGETWLWEEVTIPDEGKWLAKAFQQNTALIVCDGSYQPLISKTIGTAAWNAICTKTHIRARGLVQSTTNTASSYRSEMIGLYASLSLISAICILHNLDQGSVVIGCDNEKALELTESTSQRVPCHRKHSDILKEIGIMKSTIPIELRFQHISAHQDDHILYEDLSLPAQLNVDCDHMAKRWLIECYHKKIPPPTLLPQENTSVWIGNEKVIGDIGPPLRVEISRREMKKFLHLKGILKAEYFDMVDWKSIKRMLKNKPQQYQLWLTKQVSGFCSTNVVMERRKKRVDSICPCCKKQGVKEDARHQLVCTDPKRVEKWMEDVRTLDKWLYEFESEPNLHKMIVEYVRGRGTEYFGWDVHQDDHELYLLISTQNAIGWFNFMEGKMSIYIKKIQEDYLKYIGSRRSSCIWMGMLIDKVVELIHNQWVLRNGIIHEIQADGLKKEEQALLKHQIREELLYYNKEHVLSEDKHLYDHGFDEIWEWTGHQKCYWLHAIKTARKIKLQVRITPKIGCRKRECQSNKEILVVNKRPRKNIILNPTNNFGKKRKGQSKKEKRKKKVKRS